MPEQEPSYYQQLMNWISNGTNNQTPTSGYASFDQGGNTQVPFSEMSFGNTGASSDFMSTDYNLNNPVMNTGNTGNGGWMSTLFGGKDTSTGFQSSGVATPMVGAATAGMNAYLGLQQLKLAKNSLNFQKDAFSKQFETQRTLTNAQLRDRQMARDSATGGNTVDAYMRQNGV